MTQDVQMKSDNELHILVVLKLKNGNGSHRYHSHQQYMGTSVRLDFFEYPTSFSSEHVVGVWWVGGADGVRSTQVTTHESLHAPLGGEEEDESKH